MDASQAPFRIFTQESLCRIDELIEQDRREKAEVKREAQQDKDVNPEDWSEAERKAKTEEEQNATKPKPTLEVGRKLPLKYANAFTKEFAGIPLEDIDPYYHKKRTFLVVGKDGTIFRFSANRAFLFLGPFNPFRRLGIYVLVHPLFSFLVIMTILSNCVFMAMQPEDVPPVTETIFTTVYTTEAVIKMISRGFILSDFTYLRDPWNWLDFTVIGMAYVTMFVDLGSFSVLRVFRVFRALKTVAVIPGLKTIVSALMEAVIRLRDVMILTVFILSIFALIGLQLYRGVLRSKCVLDPPLTYNMSDTEFDEYKLNESNWQLDASGNPVICGAGICAPNFTCHAHVGDNPNYGFTGFDDFAMSMLCAFRLMTQDFWEGLYQQTLRAQGPINVFFFMINICLGSFYLVNLILAIVAMSYDEQRETDRAEREAEEKEAREEAERREKISHSFHDSSALIQHAGDFAVALSKAPEFPPDTQSFVSRPSIRSEPSPDVPGNNADNDRSANSKVNAMSLPGSPSVLKKHSLATPRLSVPASPLKAKRPSELQMISTKVLPYADDSTAVTPSSENEVDIESKATKKRSLKDKVYYPLPLALPEVIVDETSPMQQPKDLSHRSISSAKAAERAKLAIYSGKPRSASNMDMSLLSVPSAGSLRRRSSGTMSAISSIIRSSSFDRKAMIKEKCCCFLKSACSWEWCYCLTKCREIAAFFVLDAFVDLFITICIVANTAFMAIDHAHMDKDFAQMLVVANYVFTAIFAAECFLKIFAQSPWIYFQDPWSVFDSIVVFCSLLELALEGVRGLSILRSFRLLRVFKLAKSWPTLNLLMGIIGRTLGALGNLTFVLIIVIFIFAVMGMQLFGDDYRKNSYRFPDQQIPRWNFIDFIHSFMIVFRVLCGEYIESMWACMVVSGWFCVPFFLLTMIVGNLVVLNLFLALLLSSFGGDSFQQEGNDDENKIAEAIDRIQRFVAWIKGGICRIFGIKPKEKKKTPEDDAQENNNMLEADKREEPDTLSKDSAKDSGVQTPSGTVLPNCITHGTASLQNCLSCNHIHEVGNCTNGNGFAINTDSCKIIDTKEPCIIKNEAIIEAGGPSEEEAQQLSVPPGEEEESPEPPDCWPPKCYVKCKCCVFVGQSAFGRKWYALRYKANLFVMNKYFEGFIIVCIVLSSLALAVEDIDLPRRPILQIVLKVLDKVFTVIFILEMLVKWVAYGFKKYFTNAWCWLDFVIVAISIVSLSAETLGMGNIGAFKAMRTLRALRPLRAVSRWEGMKVVVNSLLGAIPSIANVMMVCLVFWLIFSIMGVQFFGGQFYKCLDDDGNRLPVNVVDHKNDCMRLNYTWENSRVTFDNAFVGYLALLQVATFKGWIEIMNDAVDSRGVDFQPSRENRVLFYIYFVIFIIFGSFFTLNLFIGVIIEKFNEMKKQAGGSIEMFMTDEQKRYYNAMKKVGGKAPQKPIPRPKWRPQAIIFDIVTNQKFDIFIMIVILVNMATMAMEHYQQADKFTEVLGYANKVFIVIFTAECVLKLFALHIHYFKLPWNVFDFVVVVASILGELENAHLPIIWMAMKQIIEKYLVSPTLLRVVRVFRVGRVLRLVKSAKGIRTLLFSLFVSLPALVNIGLLLILVMFIYSIFGMSFFMHVKHAAGIDDQFNFETLHRSMILLFQIATSAGWNGVLDALSNEKYPDCDPTLNNPEWPNGNCGNAAIGAVFLITYLIISFLVVINMYIAVILENFSQATEDVQQGLTQDDFDMFYELWEKYDQKATHYITLDQLEDFVGELEFPLGIPRPNHFRLVLLDIPICEGDMVNCLDILEALTQHFLGTPQEAATEVGPTAENTKERPNYNPVSSTLQRQRQKRAALVILRVVEKFLSFRDPDRAARKQAQKAEEEAAKQTKESSEEVGETSSPVARSHSLSKDETSVMLENMPTDAQQDTAQTSPLTVYIDSETVV